MVDNKYGVMIYYTIRTAMLLAIMTGLFMVVGYLIGGGGGMMIALLIAIAMNGFAYWKTDKLASAHIWCTRSGPSRHPSCATWWHALCQLPKLYIVEEVQPNCLCNRPFPRKGRRGGGPRPAAGAIA